MIVVGRVGRVRRPRGAQYRAQHFLGRGLADAAGHRDHAAREAGAGETRRARAGRPACRPPAAACVARQPSGRDAPAPRRRRGRAPRRHDRARRRSRPAAPRTDRPAAACGCRSRRRWRRSRRCVPSGLRQFGGRPQRLTRHLPVGAPRSHRRTAARGADDLALLVALAGDHQHVAGAQTRPAPAAIAASRPADLQRARAAGQHAARMVAGSSLRGLSSVTMARSARRAAASPISGRLPGSRSPPAPNTTCSRPCVCGRSAVSRRSSASGVWA